ncbi:hypothetical protein HOY80DRAFT_1135653 [Tuber brumale]|nr:hypothetical protein HOY80DRAFT_1135653 [Tuber brumale]
MASSAPGSAPAVGSPITRMVARRRGANSNPLVQQQKRPRPRPPAPNQQRPVPPPGPPAAQEISAENAPSTASSVSRIGSTIAAEGAGEWQEFKLTTTKASLLKGLRHHPMRMQSKRELDPTDPDQFTRPVRLHRRDPRGPLQGAKETAAANQLAAANQADEAGERAEDKVEQAMKDAQRQANVSNLAPFGGAQKQKQKVFHKNTQQVFRSNDAEKRLRYEELFRRFIEDFDNKNTWQGQLESSLSKGVFAMFLFEEGAFRMVPIEKWYKFQEKNKFRAMTFEEAELEMKKNARPPRWLMKRTEEKESQQRELEENASATKALFTRKGDRLKGEADNDDLDFEDDQFADDEEAPIMEGAEQENKEIEKRIKQEQLCANFFNARDERDSEKEELVKKRLEDVRRKHGNKVKKALMNREGNFTYESDSDRNPYATSGDEDSEDAEETARKAEDNKAEEEPKKAEAAAKNEETDHYKSKTPPVAVPASTSTPGVTGAAVAQRKSMVTGGTRRASHLNAATKKDKEPAETPREPWDRKPELKRAGTPQHTQSGTESRKLKKNTGANNITWKSTALPRLGVAEMKNMVTEKVARGSHALIACSTPSRSQPPAGAGTVNKKRKPDVTAGERIGDERFGQMSDGPGSKRQRVMATTGGRSPSHGAVAPDSRRGIPGESCTGSPAANAGAGNPSAPMSRGTPEPLDFITDAEIRRVLSSNPEGVTLKFIADVFKNRAGNEEAKKGLLSSLRRLSELTDKRTYKLKDGVGP